MRKILRLLNDCIKIEFPSLELFDMPRDFEKREFSRYEKIMADTNILREEI